MVNTEMIIQVGLVIMTIGFFVSVLGLLIMFCAAILGGII